MVGTSTRGNQARPTMQSAGRVLQVLRSFSRDRAELGVNELARELELHPSTVSRLLATLSRADFVRLDPRTGRYRLGFAILELAGFMLADVDVRREAQPIMRELAERSQETVNLAILAGRDAAIIEQAAGPRYFHYVSWIGRRVPIHATAHGKVLLAFESLERQREMLAALATDGGELPRVTSLTIATVAHFLAELAGVRARGYATTSGELDLDLAGVAAPIFDHMGTVIASLAIATSSARLPADRMDENGRLAVEGASAISERLGWRTVACSTAARR